MTTAVAPLLVLLLTLPVPGPVSPAPDTAGVAASRVAVPSTGPVAGSGGEASVTGVWPLRPVPAVVSGFDPPLSTYGAGHRGVDLLGAEGQPVLAAASGRVTFAGALAGRGVVVVSHGARRTTYEPVTAVVTVGTLVAPGQRVGTLQSTGSHCRPATCLHWGLIEGEVYLDPLTLVGAGPVRLLPLHERTR